MTKFTDLTDDELEREIFNSDAADQDEIASALFLEIVERYKNKKKECQDHEDNWRKLKELFQPFSQT